MQTFTRVIGVTTPVIGLVVPMIHTLVTATTFVLADGFGQIVTSINTIKTGVFDIASALAILMIIVAGISIMFDRDSSTEKRGQKLAFLRTVLIGYAIVFAANFLITLLTQVVPQK